MEKVDQGPYGFIRIMPVHASTENLDIEDADIEVGACVRGQTTQEQRTLFENRNNVRANDIAVCLVRSVTSNGNALTAVPPTTVGPAVWSRVPRPDGPWRTR